MDSDVKKDMEVALFNLRRLASQFENKIVELNAMKESLESARLEEVDIPSHDCDSFLAKLIDLSKLKQENADMVEAFNNRFGLESPNKATEVDRSYKELQRTYYKLKVEVETLVRKLRKDQAKGEIMESNTDEEDEEIFSVVELVEEETADKIPKQSAKDEVNEKENRKGKCAIQIKLCVGLIVCVFFYSGLAAVIKHVTEDRARNAITGGN